MLSKSLMKTYYQSAYERNVKWANSDRMVAAKLRVSGAIESADRYDETADMYARNATFVLQKLATMR